MTILIYKIYEFQLKNETKNNEILLNKFHNHEEDKESPQYNDPNKVPLLNKQFMTRVEEEFREEIRRYPINKE